MTVKGPVFSRINKKTTIFLFVCFYFFLSFYSGVLQSSENSSNDGNDKQSVTDSGATSQQKRPWLVFANNFCRIKKSFRDVSFSKKSLRMCSLPLTESDCKKATRHRMTENSVLLPTTSLLSVQGSGNTWLRWLIERLTGICTGSVYQENQMVAKGFKCELGAVYNGLTIVQKSHYFHHHKSEKTLLLIRFPFDAFVSDYHRSKTKGNHTGVANISDFAGPEWENFVWVRSGEWFDQIWTTLTKSENLLIVFYENLLTNLKRELIRIADFLQVFVTEERLRCVLENQEGKSKRQKKENAAKMAFSEIQREFLDLIISRIFIKFKIRNLPNIPLPYQITTELVRTRLQTPEK